MISLRDIGVTILTVAFSPFTLGIAAADSCIDCHQDTAFFAGYPKLHDYYQQWLGSPHQKAGLSCSNCHGGDPDGEDADTAHSGIRSMNDPESLLHFRNQPITCGQCHRANSNRFVRSRHYEELASQRSAPTCTTCHRAMSSRPELRSIVLNACRNCHGPGNSENLPLIADQAELVFQQLNITSGLLGWTRIHFESHDWPDNSKTQVEDFEERYADIVSRVHAFNLDETEDAATGLQGDLREVFDSVRQEFEQQ
jgi:formate-dependent nitrite reductase cytochrome c552 subunit